MLISFSRGFFFLSMYVVHALFSGLARCHETISPYCIFSFAYRCLRGTRYGVIAPSQSEFLPLSSVCGKACRLLVGEEGEFPHRVQSLLHLAKYPQGKVFKLFRPQPLRDHSPGFCCGGPQLFSTPSLDLSVRLYTVYSQCTVHISTHSVDP